MDPASLPSEGGATRLYLLQPKGVHLLAGAMKALTESLSDMTEEQPRSWTVQVNFKTRQQQSSGSVMDEKQPRNESLYVVRTSEYPDSLFMLATKAGMGSRRSQSRIVETDLRGDEVIPLIKGYTNRLTLTIRGSSYAIGGVGMLQASVGTLSRGDALISLVLQVRFHVHSSHGDDEAGSVIEEFVAGLLQTRQLQAGDVTLKQKHVAPESPPELSRRQLPALQYIELCKAT